MDQMIEGTRLESFVPFKQTWNLQQPMGLTEAVESE